MISFKSGHIRVICRIKGIAALWRNDNVDVPSAVSLYIMPPWVIMAP